MTTGPKKSSLIVRKWNDPFTTRVEVPCKDCTGLYLVMHPSGKESWAIRYRHNGRPRKLTLGNRSGISDRDARRLARMFLSQIAEGRDPAGEKQERKGRVAPVPLFQPAVNLHAAERFLPRAMVAERYGISARRLSTWQSDETMKFPRPIALGELLRWRLSDLLQWEKGKDVFASPIDRG